MKNKTTTDRIKHIQRYLNLEPDEIVGPDTLAVIENHLFGSSGEIPSAYSLIVSRSGLNQLIEHEIGSKAYFNRYLKKAVWPGSSSVVTIGIGYDLGHNSATQIQKDWGGKFPEVAPEKLKRVSGIKEDKSKAAVNRLKSAEVTYDKAFEVFSESTLPRYAKLTLKTCPGVDALYYDAQATLLSLVYNRGASMSRGRKREMAAIKPLVQPKAYTGIADEIINMKRLWLDKVLGGLLKRRDDEAELVRNANRVYQESELIHV